MLEEHKKRFVQHRRTVDSLRQKFASLDRKNFDLKLAHVQGTCGRYIIHGTR